MSKNIQSYNQDNNFFQANSIDNEVRLRELFSIVWKGKWTIIFVTFLFGVASIVYALHKPNIYTSEVLLAPTESEQSGGLSALAGQFGGLASLAGVNLASQNTNKSQLALEVLVSRRFTSDFIQKHNILPELMAIKSWDLMNNKVVYDEEIYNFESRKWLREVEAPYKAKPSMQEAYKEFSKIFSATLNSETGMVTLSIEHISPYIAQQWAKWLVEDINQEMKERDVLEANRSTDFLTKQIEKTHIADIRTILYKLIEEQAKTIMLANVRDEYVFKTIDPALVSEEKSKPKRALIVILGVFLGGMLSVLFLLLKHALRK